MPDFAGDIRKLGREVYLIGKEMERLGNDFVAMSKALAAFGGTIDTIGHQLQEQMRKSSQPIDLESFRWMRRTDGPGTNDV